MRKHKATFFLCFAVYKPQPLFCRGPFAPPEVGLYGPFVLRGAWMEMKLLRFFLKARKGFKRPHRPPQQRRFSLCFVWQCMPLASHPPMVQWGKGPYLAPLSVWGSPQYFSKAKGPAAHQKKCSNNYNYENPIFGRLRRAVSKKAPHRLKTPKFRLPPSPGAL